MELIDRINGLDKYFDTSKLKVGFIEQYYEMNGWDLPVNKEHLSLDEYEGHYPIRLPDGEVLEHIEQFTFDHFVLNCFISDLRDIRMLFEKEHFLYPTLSEKNAFGNAFKQALTLQLRQFEDSAKGKIYVIPFQDFITDITTGYINYEDKTDTIDNSFFYTKHTANHHLVKKLHAVLIENRLIGADTLFKDFEKILRNESIDNKIRWIGNTAELKCFINILNDQNLKFIDRKGTKWFIAEKCFIKISKTLKQISSNDLRTYKITRGSKVRIHLLVVEGIFNYKY